MAEPIRLVVEGLGRRGEGVARSAGEIVYVPYALPGETVLAERDGERAHVVELLEARPDRLAPFCPYYGTCGGCAVQTLPRADYAAWKRGLVVTALERAGVAAEVAPLIDAHGEGRRRATFHARPGEHGAPSRVGFMQARAHAIVDLAACPILAPGLETAVAAARRIATVLAPSGRPLDLLVTATDAGLDLELRGLGPPGDRQRAVLVAASGALGLARLSNHGEVLVEARAPSLRMGRADVLLPPGAFLQATGAGEEALAALVGAGVGAATRIADLFCGVGTFALRFAERASLAAYDSEARAVAALARAARTAGLRLVRAEARDLFKRPLFAEDLAEFDAIVFDPPRAGAAAQAAEIARSAVPRVVAVSCDPGTLARDLATLVEGGYRVERVTPVDQFRHAAHVEAVAVLGRPARNPRRRRLFS